MTFKWLAWCYGRWTGFVERLKSSTAWLRDRLAIWGIMTIGIGPVG